MPESLRLATFNMESLGLGGEVTLDERIAVLRPQLDRLRADVLCLQEVDGQRGETGKRRHLAALDALLEGTVYDSFRRVHTHSRSTGGARDRHNLVILARFPITDHRELRHDLVAPPTCHPVDGGGPRAIEWDRPILHAALDLGGDRVLHVVNVHLRAPRAAYVAGGKQGSDRWLTMRGWAEGMFLAVVKRAGQALETRLFLDALMDAEAQPLIAVCGDFNADLHETPVRAIRGDEEDAGNPHLIARTLVPLERSLPRSQRFSVVHHGRPQMLDHVLVSRRLYGWYLGSEIHNEALGDEMIGARAVPGGPESFHAPVVAAFEIPDG